MIVIGYDLVSYLLHYSSARCVTFKELFVCKSNNKTGDIIRKSKCSTDFKRNDFLKKTKRTHWVRFVHLNSLIESCVFLYLWNSPFDTFL